MEITVQTQLKNPSILDSAGRPNSVTAGCHSLDISGNSAETAEKAVSILVISPFEEDHAGPDWHFQRGGLIVAHRLGDDSLWALWAEALNLGARDLLLKPFDWNEVLWAVRSALRHGPTGCAPR